MGKRRVFWAVVCLVGVACSGSTTGNEQRDPETLISDLCSQMIGMNCPDGFADAPTCTAALLGERSEASAKGCGAEFDGLILCYLSKLTACGQKGPDICPAEVDAANACMDSEDDRGLCSMGMGGAPAGAPSYYQQCDVDCSTWGASCETVSSPTLECTCTKGPKAGMTFSPASCQAFTLSVAAQNCG